MCDCVREISFDVRNQRLQAVKYGTKIPILFDTCVIITFWSTTVIRNDWRLCKRCAFWGLDASNDHIIRNVYNCIYFLCELIMTPTINLLPLFAKQKSNILLFKWTIPQRNMNERFWSAFQVLLILTTRNVSRFSFFLM